MEVTHINKEWELAKDLKALEALHLVQVPTNHHNIWEKLQNIQ
jgi:hypothetical protein